MQLFRPKADPLAEFSQGWRADFSVPPREMEALPFYSMTVRIDPTSREDYTGTLDLTFPVTGATPLNELYFRTYPNLYAFGGNLQIIGAEVNGATVGYSPAAEGSAVHLSLPTPLEPGTRANVRLSFSGSVERESQPGEYTIFGANEDVLSLTNFYPILAARRGDEWALDIPHPQGDVGFHDAALYRVAVTTPPEQTVAATGTEITRTTGADGWHDALRPGPGAGVHRAAQPALSGGRGRDAGHPCALLLLPRRRRGRTLGSTTRWRPCKSTATGSAPIPTATWPWWRPR